MLINGAAGGIGTFAVQIAKAAAGPKYDVVLHVVGNRSLADHRRALAPNGTLVLVGSGVGREGGHARGKVIVSVAEGVER